MSYYSNTVLWWTLFVALSIFDNYFRFQVSGIH